MNTIKDFYSKHSLQYELFEKEALINIKRFPLLYNIRNKERKLLGKGANKKVFYFATGSGRDIVYLAKLNAKIVTLDFSIEMINRTCARLKKEGIKFKLFKNISNLTADFLDSFFEKNKNCVFIVAADIDKVKLPQSYFDYTFCYCTLPLMKNWKLTLKKLLHTSKSGAVSVYDKEKLPILNEYYRKFGFESKVRGRTITISGGFEYFCIPQSSMTEVIEKGKKLNIIQLDLGKIYVWH